MLSDREAKNAVFYSVLTENQGILNRKLAYATKSVRQNHIQKNPSSNEGITAAAIEIQRVWRGYLTRAYFFGILHPNVSKTAVYSGSKVDQQRQEDFINPQKSAARLHLESKYQAYIQGLMESNNPPDILPSFEDFCATCIQQCWRNSEGTRKKRKKQPAQIKNKKARIRKILSIKDAAIMIQRAWRKHIDIQVYRYYRDLISFKTRGNPALMLRCINPLEAKMLDAAAGIHVKFRLAGDRFPPNIYYKIYTHRPIQDLGANSPKDYTKACVKLKMAKDQHSKGRYEVKKEDMSGWYLRMDNNGWRLVSDRLIHHMMADPVTWDTSHKKYEYHHDKLVRKQDVEKRKKKKKIEWMKKMYKDGLLKAKSDDKETVQLIEGAAAGMVATVENYGTDALEDWEVDELLDWTTSLNFEDYQNGWKELATSANSEQQIEDKMRLLTSTADPYEFTLSTVPSRYQSTQHSRNTPASSISSANSRPQAVT